MMICGTFTLATPHVMKFCIYSLLSVSHATSICSSQTLYSSLEECQSGICTTATPAAVKYKVTTECQSFTCNATTGDCDTNFINDGLNCGATAPGSGFCQDAGQPTCKEGDCPSGGVGEEMNCTDNDYQYV